MSKSPIIPRNDEETAAFLASVQDGIADADAGRTVPYSAVREWLLSWGTEPEKPTPNLIP